MNNNLRDGGQHEELRTEKAIAMSRAFARENGVSVDRALMFYAQDQSVGGNSGNSMDVVDDVVDRFLSLRRRAKRMDSEGEDIDVKRFHVDVTNLDEYFAFLENRTQAIDSYCRELQGYMTLFKEFKALKRQILKEMSQEALQNLEMLLLAAAITCNDLDDRVQDVLEAMHEMVLVP